MTRMQGHSGWAPPHDEEHDEDGDCRGPNLDSDAWCEPVGAKPERGYEPPPRHYEGNGIMPWEVIDAWGLDYYLGNVAKYICRAGKKNNATRLDDLNKARNFIGKAIELELEAERNER